MIKTIHRTRGCHSMTVAVLLAIVLCGCLRSPEQKEATFLAHGKEYYAKKDYTRAVLQFKNAAAVMPKDAEPYYQLGLTYMMSGDGDAAVAALKKALVLNPQHLNSQLTMAQLLSVQIDDPDLLREAKKRLTKILAVSPENAEALKTLAFTDWKLGQPEDAERHLRSVLTQFPADLRTSMALAVVKIEQNDLKGAEDVLKTAAAHQPPVADAFIALAEFYASTKRLTEAELLCRRALEINPKSTIALLDLAGIQMRLGQQAAAEQTYLRLARVGDKRYSHVHAVFLFRSGKHNQAITEFERLANQDPQDRTARSRLVEAYLQVNRFADATSVLSSALQTNSRDVEALIQRCQLYLIAGKLTEAQSDLTQALRYEPNSADAHYLMSKLHLARHSILSQREELGEVLRLNSRYLRARIELAQVLVGTNAARSAVGIMGQAPADQKKEIAFIIEQNWVLLAAGDKDEFRKGVATGLATSRQPELLLQNSVLTLSDRAFADARYSAEQVLKLNPDDTRALSVLVHSYREEKGAAAAMHALEQYAASHPQSAPVQQFLGEFMWVSGRTTDARRAFTSALAVEENNEMVTLEMASLDAADGHLDDARKEVNRVLSTNAGNATARFLLAKIEHKAGNLKGAMDLYRSVLEAQPNNAVALNNLAYLLTNSAGRPDEALPLAQKAKELAPDDPSVEGTLGWVLYQKGLYDVALEHLKTSAAKNPTAVIQYHLAMAYFKTGNPQQSRQTLEAALHLDPKLPEAASARQLLAASNGVDQRKMKP